MWFPWRRSIPQPDIAPILSLQARIALRRKPEYIPQILTAEQPQQPRILKEPRISKAEAVNSLKRIVYDVETIWLQGNTENSVMVKGTIYAWKFRKEAAGTYSLNNMREAGGGRAAGQETWGKDPILDVLDRERTLLFKKIRDVQESV